MASPKVPRKPRVRKFGFPVEAHELTDLATLPQRFDMFASEIREGLDQIGREVLPLLNRIEDTVGALGDRLTKIERTQTEHGARLAALEATVHQLDLARRHHKKR